MLPLLGSSKLPWLRLLPLVPALVLLEVLVVWLKAASPAAKYVRKPETSHT
jgi:hypothetical protein